VSQPSPHFCRTPPPGPLCRQHIGRKLLGSCRRPVLAFPSVFSKYLLPLPPRGVQLLAGGTRLDGAGGRTYTLPAGRHSCWILESAYGAWIHVDDEAPTRPGCGTIRQRGTCVWHEGRPAAASARFYQVFDDLLVQR